MYNRLIDLNSPVLGRVSGFLEPQREFRRLSRRVGLALAHGKGVVQDMTCVGYGGHQALGRGPMDGDGG